MSVFLRLPGGNKVLDDGGFEEQSVPVLLRDVRFDADNPDFPSGLQFSLRPSPYSCYPSASWAA